MLMKRVNNCLKVLTRQRREWMTTSDPSNKSSTEQRKHKNIKELKSMNNEQEFQYSYEGINTYEHLTTREEYLGDRSKKRVKQKLAKIGLQSFKSEMMKRTQQMITGSTTTTAEHTIQYDLWEGNQSLYTRKYDRIYSKELNWHQRDEATSLSSAYKTSHLFTARLQDQQVRQLIQQLQTIVQKSLKNTTGVEHDRASLLIDPEHQDLVTQLQEKGKEINIQHLPQLVMEVGHLGHCKHPDVWTILEDRLFKYLHTYDLQALALIKYGLTSLVPKKGNLYLHKALDDLVFSHLQQHQVDIHTLLHLHQAYRQNITHTKNKVFLQLLMKAKDEVSKGHPDIVAQVLYSFFNNRIKDNKRRKLREKNEKEEEQEEMLKTYKDLLQKNISEMSTHGLILTLQIGMLSKNNPIEIYYKVEQELINRQLLETLDSIQLGLVIRAFATGSHRQPVGSSAFYQALQPAIQSHWKQGGLSRMDRARVMWLYSCCPNYIHKSNFFDTLLFPYAIQYLDKMQHGELHYLAYTLLFTNTTDQQIWARFIKRVCLLNQVVPLNYFNSFKLVQLYLQQLFPEWNLEPYLACLLASERVYTTSSLEGLYLKDSEYIQFSSVLVNEMQLKTTNFVDFHNTFLIDYLDTNNRIVIYLIRHFHKHQDHTLRPMVALQAQLLRGQHYAVMFCDFNQYIKMTQSERKQKFMSEFNKLVEEQKSVLKDLEDQKWNEYAQKVQDRAESINSNNFSFLNDIEKQIRQKEKEEQEEAEAKNQ